MRRQGLRIMEKQMPRVSIWTNDTDEHIADFGILIIFLCFPQLSLVPVSISSGFIHMANVQALRSRPVLGKRPMERHVRHRRRQNLTGCQAASLEWWAGTLRPFGQQDGPEQLRVPTTSLRAAEGSTRDGQRGRHQPRPPSEQGTAPTGPSGDPGFQLSLM